MPPLRIAHLTSVHPRHDSRVFVKQCRTAAAAGHEVSLVVADGLGDETRDGVGIIDVGRPRGRTERMISATLRVLRRAQALGADLYHLHDPELLAAGLALKRRGARVIFDAHEDLPIQVLSKPYLPGPLRPAVAWVAGSWAHLAGRRLDGVVAATPAIAGRFRRAGIDATVVANYPLAGELHLDAPWPRRRTEVCYVGSIAEARGVGEMVDAMAFTRPGTRLVLGGAFAEGMLRARCAASPGWPRVDAIGHLTRPQVAQALAAAMAGLVTLRPTPAYRESLPIKMFEYMSAGLPVIASDFPLWREIVEGGECGICVDPLDPRRIAAAIDDLIGDPDRAQAMGENGRRLTLERYNWTPEGERLLALYARLAGAGAA